jgi:5-methylcytosine-specific restriction protein A
MPTAALRHCSGSPTCPNFQGQCATHGTTAQRRDQARGTAQERGYDHAWADYSKRFRAAHPVCGQRADNSLDRVNSRCVQEGRTTPSECVDHNVPMSQGGSKWDEKNHTALCLACNTWKRNTLEQQRVGDETL